MAARVRTEAIVERALPLLVPIVACIGAGYALQSAIALQSLYNKLNDMAMSRLLSLIEVVEGGPRADEVALGENTKILKILNIKRKSPLNHFQQKNEHLEMLKNSFFLILAQFKG